ncbi:uncharacterized protein JCM6883_006803 [Sporobolomyces salmoneus]|uniref:uncharacterized protein n=1 Tax=Sporobolomyces salmoneus TaxID=183962 RepID=UPI0031811ADA
MASILKLANVDAKLGHLLGLDTHVSLGLSKLLKGLLGGLLGKREVATEQLYKRANDDLVNVDLDSTIGHNSHADVSAVVGGHLDTETLMSNSVTFSASMPTFPSDVDSKDNWREEGDRHCEFVYAY